MKKSVRLAAAAVLLGIVTPCVGTAQEAPPIQFNVTYRCSDIDTLVIHRREVNERGEWFFFQVTRNGQPLGETYQRRENLVNRLRSCRLLPSNSTATPAATPAATPPRATNPPYLSEMPTVDRVMREIRGSDPDDTAARQAGALSQLRDLIRNVAYTQRRDDSRWTPDEQRIANAYAVACAGIYERLRQSLSTTTEGGKRFFELGGYSISHEFRDAVFKQFSPTLIAEHTKAEAFLDARHAQIVKAQADADKQEAAQQAATGRPERAVARCIAAGRPALSCVSLGLESGFGELLSGLDPSLVKKSAPGFRMGGAYPGPKGSIKVFGQGSAVIGCNDIAGFFDYTVDSTEGRVRVNILQSDQKPVVLELRPDGRLDGAGQTIVVSNTYEVGTSTTSSPVTSTVTTHYMASKSAVCTMGLMGPGVQPDFGFVGAFLDKASQDLTKAKPIKATPGLRMNGEYAGQGDFSVEFFNESALVGCGDAFVADPYVVERAGNRFSVNIQHDGKLVVLALAPDGRLQGSGPIQVRGRVLTGREANGDLAFRPIAANCTIGSLTASTGSNSAPASAGSPVATPATAVVSLAAGLPSPPGAVNPASGQPWVWMLVKDNLDNILTKSGYRPPAGMSPRQGWRAACQKGGPECQQGVDATRPYVATTARMDPTGSVTFPAVSAGSYHVWGAIRHGDDILYWDLPVTLKSGANPVTLTEKNALR